MLPPADIKHPRTDPTLAHLVRPRLPRRRHCRVALDLARRSVFGTFLPHSSLPRHRGRICDRAVSDGSSVGDECGNVGDKAAGHAAGDSEEVLKGWCNLVAFSHDDLMCCSCRERGACCGGIASAHSSPIVRAHDTAAGSPRATRPCLRYGEGRECDNELNAGSVSCSTYGEGRLRTTRPDRVRVNREGE